MLNARKKADMNPDMDPAEMEQACGEAFADIYKDWTD